MKIIFAATLFLTLFAGSLRAAEVDPNSVIQKISDAAKSGLALGAAQHRPDSKSGLPSTARQPRLTP